MKPTNTQFMGQISKMNSNSVNSNDLPMWQRVLADRGILQSALTMGWQGARNEWAYPIHDQDGLRLTQRTKAYPHSNATAKYRWLPAKPKGADYYAPPALATAIAQANGVVYLAAGEVDVLTYLSAGLPNVLAWFGEASVPKDLAVYLQTLGAQHVIYLPDKDNTGLRSATVVRDRLFNSPLTYSPRRLPDTLPDKADTNDLWQAVNFDAEQFQHAIQTAPELTLPEMQMQQERATFRPRTRIDSDDTFESIMTAIHEALGIEKYDDNGWSNYIPCIFHNHQNDHIRPRSQWNRNTNTFYCHKCGQSWSAKETAEALNIEWIAPKRKKSTNQAEQPTMQERILPIVAEPFTADMTVNMRYISDLSPLPDANLLIKSPIGTGKTETAKRVIDNLSAELGREPAVLVITHRRALTANLCERLNLENYDHIESSWLRSVPRLGIVYNSLPHLMLYGEQLPQYDLLIIDEIEQFHQHLGGSTFTGNESRKAYQILTQLVKTSTRMLAFDAHCTDISRDWIREHAGTVTTIDNTYQPSRGAMTLYKNREAVVEKAQSLIDENQGAVVIATSSKREAKLLHHYFSDAYGYDYVKLISGDNSEDKSTQDFIRHINTRLPHLKALIYTPSLGTGIDITCKVRAVMGIFKGKHLNAGDLHQMLGRCRNAQETHVYLQAIRTQQPEMWETIFERQQRNAQQTALICGFDEDGVWQADDVQKDILKLLAKLQAKHNRSLNDLLSSFVALAEGYNLHYDESQHEVMREILIRVQEKVDEADKQAVLNADPIDHAQLDMHRKQGTLTPEIRAGHQRWRIEDTIGRTITAEIYDNLRTGKQRDHVRRLTDTLTDEETLKQRDREQAENNHLLMNRQHATMHRHLLQMMMQLVWNKHDLRQAVDIELTAEEIEKRFAPFMQLHAQDLVSYFNWRWDQSHEAVAIVRWMLKKVGIKLPSRQVCNNGERYRVYSLDADAIETLYQYAHARKKHLRHQRDEMITQNVVVIYNAQTEPIPDDVEYGQITIPF